MPDNLHLIGNSVDICNRVELERWYRQRRNRNINGIEIGNLDAEVHGECAGYSQPRLIACAGRGLSIERCNSVAAEKSFNLNRWRLDGSTDEGLVALAHDVDSGGNAQ